MLRSKFLQFCQVGSLHNHLPDVGPGRLHPQPLARRWSRSASYTTIPQLSVQVSLLGNTMAPLQRTASLTNEETLSVQRPRKKQANRSTSAAVLKDREEVLKKYLESPFSGAGWRVLEPNTDQNGSVLAGYMGFNKCEELNDFYASTVCQAIGRYQQIRKDIGETAAKFPILTSTLLSLLKAEDSETMRNISGIKAMESTDPAFKEFPTVISRQNSRFLHLHHLSLHFLLVSQNPDQFPQSDHAMINGPAKERRVYSDKGIYYGIHIEDCFRCLSLFKYYLKAWSKDKKPGDGQLAAKVRYITDEELANGLSNASQPSVQVQHAMQSQPHVQVQSAIPSRDNQHWNHLPQTARRDECEKCKAKGRLRRAQSV